MRRSRRTDYRLVELDGSIPAVHVRLDHQDGTKTFLWQQEDGTPGLGGRPVVTLPLYGLRRLAVAAADAPVYLTEGEKAADALARIDIVALATVTGAAATPDVAVLDVLAGREVRLWPDNDEPGRSHMAGIALLLHGVAASVGFVDWADAPDGGDAADYVAPGATQADVLALPIDSADLQMEAAAEGVGTGAIHSAGRPFHKAAEPNLVFQTAREFAASMPPDISWIAKPYVASGAITGVDGKIKAAGKTTLVTYLCRAVLDGLPFLGTPTRRTGVVYLTEQPPTSFRETLRRADLLDREDFVVLTWRKTAAMAWLGIVDAAVAECADRSAGLLVIDTLSRFAGIHGDGENHAGEAEAAMAPLQVAAADGLAVVVVRHERKAGGEVGDSGRGSTAFGGAADIVMAVRRRSGNGAPNSREIHALSRFDETPDQLVIELTDVGYRVLGEGSAVAHDETKAAVLQLLSSESRSPLTTDQILELSHRGRTTVQGVLEELLTDGRIERGGGGRKGDPYRYYARAEVVDGTAPEAMAQPGEAALLADLLLHVGGDMESIGEFHD